MLLKERLIPIRIGDKLIGLITYFIGDNTDKFVRNNPFDVLEDDENEVPHPFTDYWYKPLPNNLEIILVEKNIAKKIQKKTTRKKGAVDIINEEYEVGAITEFKKDLDISDYESNHRKLQKLHKDIKYRKLKLK